jgi:hypothetical protein
MGPLSAKSYLGRDLVRPHPPPAGRARQAIDYGRRGTGYVFGAFCPATGAAVTRPYPGRGTANWIAFLEEVERWLPHDVERVYAIADNLSSHRGTDVLLFMLAHPRWEMVFQPKYAADLNLLEPWWKILRSPWRGAGSRPGTRSPPPSRRRPTTGMPIAIPSPGDSGAAIARVANPASRFCPKPRNLPDEPLSR